MMAWFKCRACKRIEWRDGRFWCNKFKRIMSFCYSTGKDAILTRIKKKARK